MDITKIRFTEGYLNYVEPLYLLVCEIVIGMRVYHLKDFFFFFFFPEIDFALVFGTLSSR